MPEYRLTHELNSSYLAETSTPGQGGEEVDEKLVELNNVDQRMRDMHIETVKTRWFGSSSNFSFVPFIFRS
jgi:hypothetical protein